MKVSLITVCYNSAATIRTAIESVLSQSGVDIEYVVVDGGSTDGTVSLLQGFEARVGNGERGTGNGERGTGNGEETDSTCSTRLSFRWISERDRGMYDAINKGISMATGDVVGILNADDMLEASDTLANIAAQFGEQGTGNGERIEAVYADIRFVKSDLNTTVRYYSAAHWEPWMHNWGFMPPHPSVYIRRELFSKFGGYKLGYQISADFELMVRYLCRNEIRTSYMPECVVKMRMGGKSTKNWRANVLLNVENVRANRENGYFSCFPMMLPKYLFKIWGFVFRRQHR